MKRLIAGAAGLAVATAYFVLSALPALGADSGTVNAQVTVASPCLTLDVTSINFGTGSFSQPSQAMTQLQNHQLNVSSCGTTSQGLFARGTDATASDGSDATWALIGSAQSDLCTQGLNKYFLSNYLWNGSSQVASVGITPVNRQFVDQTSAGYRLAAGGSLRIDQLLFMPCTGSAGAGKTMNFQLTYTATL